MPKVLELFTTNNNKCSNSNKPAATENSAERFKAMARRDDFFLLSTFHLLCLRLVCFVFILL